MHIEETWSLDLKLNEAMNCNEAEPKQAFGDSPRLLPMETYMPVWQGFLLKIIFYFVLLNNSLSELTFIWKSGLMCHISKAWESMEQEIYFSLKARFSISLGLHSVVRGS